MNGLLSVLSFLVRLPCFAFTKQRLGNQNAVAESLTKRPQSFCGIGRTPRLSPRYVEATKVIGLTTTMLLLTHPSLGGNEGQPQPRRDRSATPLVDPHKPSVFISFMRSAQVEPLETGVGRTYLWFRITNNMRWPIWLNMFDVPQEYGDAGVYFRIEDKQNGKPRIDSRCHVCSFNPLGAGRSIAFSLPRDYASVDARLSIEYSFQWERATENVGGSSSTHSVNFYLSYLPKSVWNEPTR